jgi:hypothetical protein
MNCKSLKYQIYLLCILLILGSCREEKVVPQVGEARIIFTHKSDTLTAGKFTFLLPDGAVTSDTEISIEEEASCNFVHPSNEVYFFRCIFSITPGNVAFNSPVTLSVTEDKYWLRAVNELGLVQDFPLSQLRLYEVDMVTGTSTQVPEPSVQVSGNKVTVSGKVTHLGNYQIGVPRRAIQFLGGKIEAVLTEGLTKNIIIESNRTGSGGALQTTQYLSGTLVTAIALVADPIKPKEFNAIRILTSVAPFTSPSNIMNEDGTNEVLIVLFENQERMDIKSIEGEKAIVHFTTYEKVGGLVEGTYQTKGIVLQTGQEVNLLIHFSVRRVT